MGFFSFLIPKSSNSEYLSLISYFKSKKFGSEPGVMTILSNLPPKDRCVILTGVLKSDPKNFRIYDKLSMAHMKNGDVAAAHDCLNIGLRSGNLINQNFETLKIKIDSMSLEYGGKFGSSSNYQDALARIERDKGLGSTEFVTVIKAFCLSKLK